MSSITFGGSVESILGADAPAKGVYHFLDVGAEKYGDCIVVEFGSTRVLIDGSHEGDFDGQEGYDSTPEQLQQIFKGEATPHPITLMVVTHCHQDHIGALPKLVANGVIKPTWALITDHKLGFGRSDDDGDASTREDLRDERTQRLAAALREEDASDLDDDELEAFIDKAMTVEAKYKRMIADLISKGVKVIEYRGQPLPAALVAAMKPTGMTLLGPSTDQMVLAAEQIATTNKEAVDAVRDAQRADRSVSDVDLYRRLVTPAAGDDTGSDAFNARGNGMNCQSITLAFGPKDSRVLLAGDMQFSEPGVRGADEEVEQLIARVRDAGPYKVFKTTHHTSHNGHNEDILAAFGDPPIIVHTGGSRDAGHPHHGMLRMLKSRSRDIRFARTDRNGLITVRPYRAVEDAVQISRGRLNDFTANEVDLVESTTPTVTTAVATTLPNAEVTPAQVIIVNLPGGEIDMRVAGVDIVMRRARTPSSARSSARLTPDLQGPRARVPAARVRSEVPELAVAGGRKLSRLLFVTNSEKLKDNIGRFESQVALDALRRWQPDGLVDIATQARRALEAVRSELRNDPSIAGVVVLGGYDVVPSIVVDVLPRELRDQLGKQEVAQDDDRFVVWSDEPYGDIDGDRIAERPVSRIPDARDSALFFRALQAREVVAGDRFGIRNVERPFADTVWSEVKGRRDLNVSREFVSAHVSPSHSNSGCQYFMLHGSDTDATTFSGEPTPEFDRAFSVTEVPESFQGLVFSGCCWGALTVSEKAIDAGSGHPAPRIAERSIALSYLKAGANAFVGCTGAHYSGRSVDADANYASRMHSAFWKTLPEVGYSAALALFGARQYYGGLIAGGGIKREPRDLARRLKNRTQFTCLGLGW